MKKNIQSIRFVALLAFSALSCQFSMTQAQDSLYIYKGGAVVAKRAVLQIDSMTFTAPAPTACGAYLGAGNTLYKQFLCRNLGAAGDLYSITNALSYNAADNGDLYQWGRPTDGHEKLTSATTSTLATSNTPGNADFIRGSYDWRSGGGNDSRWTDATKAANDPCPLGYKVPSQAQWAGVVANNTRGTWASGYQFGANLFLPASGLRSWYDGSLDGANGYYWSSTAVSGTDAGFLRFDGGSADAMAFAPRTFGFSVRCVAE